MLYVVLPCFNSADTVARAIESVYNQTYFEDEAFELVLVDNNSKDDLDSAIDEYIWEDNFIHMKCDIQGVAPALNAGIFYACSQDLCTHIARIDADDVWRPTKLEKQMEYMEQNKLDVCGTSMRFHSIAADYDVHYPQDHRQIYSFLYNGNNPIGHPSVVINKDVFLHCGGYDENYKGAEDHDLWVRSINRFRFGNLHEVLVDYTLSPKQRSDGDTNANKSSLKLRV